MQHSSLQTVRPNSSNLPWYERDLL